MIDRLGIIPAAGKASRFEGVMKELLPVVAGDILLIDCAYSAMRMCGEVLIVTNLAKLPALAAHLPDATYRLQQTGKDAWGAIVESLPRAGRRNLYAMPDTWFNRDAFDIDFPDDFTLGVFVTDKPERFGMLRNGQIVDKQPGQPGRAWGVLVWSDRVAEYWFEHLHQIETHTQAFNMAIREFGYTTFDLRYYYDCADLAAYKELLNDV